MSVDEEAMLPGERLRRAREEQGLSQDEVSKHLRLSLSYLRALEEDDYDRLPEPPFIKGYLRNYARFLGLPPRSWRAASSRKWTPSAAPRTSAIRTPWRTRPGQGVASAAAGGPGGGAGGGPGLVAVAPGRRGPRRPGAGWRRAGGGECPGGRRHPEPALPEDNEPAAPADDTLEPGPENGGAPAGDAAPASPDGSGPAPARPMSRPPAGESELADADTPDAADSAGAAEPSPADDGVDRLRLSFSRVCWIKVVDASGATSARGSARPATALPWRARPRSGSPWVTPPRCRR